MTRVRLPLARHRLLDRQTFYLDVKHTCRGIEFMDLVPNLSPQNLVSVDIGKEFMLKHGYIKHDCDVQKRAAPEFMEEAARMLLEERWKKETKAKLPDATQLLSESRLLG